MSPEQCREARELLRWSQRDLATAADVPLSFVIDFEDGDSPAFLVRYEIALHQALERAGVGFPFSLEGGQVKSAWVTYSPRGEGEAN